ncbi:MAG: septum formation initiator family protein [Candidatus Zixiibacteriota bacterium]|nr:MAG: septum formation initiator family protein [candidate division Zixibacteria bacterium]
MPRRVKKSSSLLAPLTEDFVRRVSGTSQRFRRKIVKYGFWVIGILFAYSLMSGTYGIPRIIRLEMERQALLEANHRQLVDLVDAARIREMLQSDHSYIGYLARTRYHMAYPDETIYRYQGQK